MTKYQVTVMGGGSFGTALANIIAHNGHAVTLWMRDAKRAAQCQSERQNAHYLPGHIFSENLTASSSMQSVESSDLVVVSVPSSGVREVARQIAPLVKQGTFLVSTTKGVETEGFHLMSDILEQEIPGAVVGALSGPNFAKEIVENHYTGSVIASGNEQLNERVQSTFSSSTFRVYSNDDKRGVELAGALKNIYAIIVGLAETLGCGANTTAMLLTRGLAEMRRFSLEHGAKELTFLGLAGMGDLVLTCGSDLSRNYRVGAAIAKGASVEEAEQAIGQVAEGINTLNTVWARARKLDIYMPLVNGLYDIVHRGHAIDEVVKGLMTSEFSEDVQVIHS